MKPVLGSATYLNENGQRFGGVWTNLDYCGSSGGVGWGSALGALADLFFPTDQPAEATAAAAYRASFVGARAFTYACLLLMFELI